MNKLLFALIVITLIAVSGILDALYRQVIVSGLRNEYMFDEGLIDINIVHWCSFWGALAGIFLFYFRTKYQGEQIDLQRREQIDGRFTAAVTLLGSGETSARTGAIYSLYHLAVEDEKYRKEIAQILCSHIRSKTQEKNYQKKHEEQPSNEIQTAINLLFRNKAGNLGLYKNDKILGEFSNADLSRSYLVGADFRSAKCRKVIFEHAECQGAKFHSAECQGANFTKAKCQTTEFTMAHCQDAIFHRAECQGAFFFSAKCQNASFGKAMCERADFIGAYCQKTYFGKAHCEGADFGHAWCQGVGFENAQCQFTRFDHAHCEGADFRGAQCQGASFDSTCFQGTIFSDANFQGAYAYTNKIPVVPNLMYPLISGKAEEPLLRIGKNTELKNAVFSWPLSAESIKEIEDAKRFIPMCYWHTLMQRIIDDNKNKWNKEDRYVLPKDSGMVTGVLEDSKEIQQIIAKLKEIKQVNRERFFE